KSYQPSHQTHPSYSIGAVDGIVGKGTLLALDEALMDGWQVVSATQINWADSKFGILLGSVESKNDYSAYNKTKGGLKSFYRTNLDKMTIVEVLKKQESRDIFAAGRFQLIPDTLKDAINKLSIDTSLVFDKN
ncbi:TPA: type VI secretion system tip protein VgrG, partial [Vibrio cholerae]|nr:type VI secretion system tip protein VgrG [Vibrio cholerae]